MQCIGCLRAMDADSQMLNDDDMRCCMMRRETMAMASFTHFTVLASIKNLAQACFAAHQLSFRGDQLPLPPPASTHVFQLFRCPLPNLASFSHCCPQKRRVKLGKNGGGN
jgi:hypothetical protein